MPILLPRHAELLAWMVTAAIFVLDAMEPPGYALGVLYAGVILCAFCIPRRRFALQYAIIATGLAIVGLFLKPAGGDWTLGVFNRCMSIGALWVTAGGIMLYQRAIEARYAAERLAREQVAMANLGRMAAAVAHEFRNALMGIGMSIDLAYSAVPLHARDETMRQESANRLRALGDTVSDLLAYAEPRPPVIVPVPLAQLVSEAVALIHKRPDCAGVSVHVDLPDVLVSADREQIKGLLFSLIVNAAQAMSGRGDIAITAAASDGICEVAVTDSGPGVSADAWARLFEPFFSTKNHGLGVGLATARRVAQAHGGTVELKRAPRGGTTAVLRLPIHQDHATAA